MENKMEGANLHYQRGRLSLYTTAGTNLAPSFFRSGWESLLPPAAQYRNPYLDHPANNRPTYYIDVIRMMKKLNFFYTSLFKSSQSIIYPMRNPPQIDLYK